MSTKDEIKDNINIAADKAKLGVDKATGAAKDLAHNAADKVKDVGVAIGNKIKDAGGAVKDAAHNAKDKMNQAGDKIDE